MLPAVRSIVAAVSTTSGETISWQTETLNAKILRSDADKHDWRWISSDMDSESDAEQVLKGALGIS